MLSGTPERRGWRAASTFAGFCDHHDTTTFESLESVPFAGTPQQTFLLAYRAECHEVYQKQASSGPRNHCGRCWIAAGSPTFRKRFRRCTTSRAKKSEQDLSSLAGEKPAWTKNS